MSHCIHRPLSLSPGAGLCKGMQWRLPEGDLKGFRACRGSWLGTHTLPGPEAHQDSKMGRTRLGQLSHPPGEKGTPIQREMGHLWPKHKRHWQQQWGVLLFQALPVLPTLENSQGSRAFHPSQPQQSLLTLCTHRTSGLMISRPGGRGYKARILSHKATSQGSTTASGLQVGNSGCSNIISLGLSPATPAHAQQ